jgi:hypothetical protein
VAGFMMFSIMIAGRNARAGGERAKAALPTLGALFEQIASST